MAARHLSWLQRGHDEARVGLALCPLRLGDHAPPSAPALPGRPAQVLEAPRRLARPSGLLLDLDQLDRDLLDEAVVAGKPEHVVDPVLLAPGHQDLAGEARVGPKQDAHPRGGSKFYFAVACPNRSIVCTCNTPFQKLDNDKVG